MGHAIKAGTKHISEHEMVCNSLGTLSQGRVWGE